MHPPPVLVVFRRSFERPRFDFNPPAPHPPLKVHQTSPTCAIRRFPRIGFTPHIDTPRFMERQPRRSLNVVPFVVSLAVRRSPRMDDLLLTQMTDGGVATLPEMQVHTALTQSAR